MMDPGGRDQAPDAAFVAGERSQEFEHSRVVTSLLSAQRKAHVTPDVPVVEGDGPGVTERMVTDQPDGPRPDAGQCPQTSADPFDVVVGGP